MMHFTDLSGLAGVVFAGVALTLRLPAAARLPGKRRVWLAAVLATVLVLPFGGLSAAELMRGITGDLSITTLLLLGLALQGSGGPSKQKYGLLAFVAVAALALYPFALGVGMFDTYRLGFGSPWFIAGLLLLALASWLRLYPLVALGVSLAVLAWNLGWYESGNLWDYLLDPWLSVYALLALGKLGASRLAERVR